MRPLQVAAIRAGLALACLSFAWAISADAQNAPAGDFDSVVASYVAEGLRSNLALQGQTLEVERAAQSLAEARSRFLPQLQLEARYTRAEGGRDIEFPI